MNRRSRSKFLSAAILAAIFAALAIAPAGAVGKGVNYAGPTDQVYIPSPAGFATDVPSIQMKVKFKGKTPTVIPGGSMREKGAYGTCVFAAPGCNAYPGEAAQCLLRHPPRSIASGRLLREPGGFEGLLSIHEGANANDLSVPNRVDRSGVGFHERSTLPPPRDLVPKDDNFVAPSVDVVSGPQLDPLPDFEVLCKRLGHLLPAVVDPPLVDTGRPKTGSVVEWARDS